jgi:hypothetical protein
MVVFLSEVAAADIAPPRSEASAAALPKSRSIPEIATKLRPGRL